MIMKDVIIAMSKFERLFLAVLLLPNIVKCHYGKSKRNLKVVRLEEVHIRGSTTFSENDNATQRMDFVFFFFLFIS